MRWWLAVVAALVCAPCLAGAKKAVDRPRDGSLKVGDAAPDFELKRLEGGGSVRLSAFAGKCPVVLIFGSYT